MEALPRLLNGLWLPLATATKRGPDIGGTQILQMVTVVLGLVGGAVCYFVLSTLVEPRLRRYLERKFGVTICVGQILKFWHIEGGSPATTFAVGLLWWPCALVELAGFIVPFFLLYALAERI